jgi:hypothetical protein
MGAICVLCQGGAAEFGLKPDETGLGMTPILWPLAVSRSAARHLARFRAIAGIAGTLELPTGKLL